MQVQLQQPGYPLHKAAKKRGDNDMLIQVPGMKCVSDLIPCACRDRVVCMHHISYISQHLTTCTCGRTAVHGDAGIVLHCTVVLAV